MFQECFKTNTTFYSNWPMSCSIILSQMNGPNGQNLASLDQNVILRTVQASWWSTCQSLVMFLRHRGFKMKRLFPKKEKRKWWGIILMRNWFKESIWKWDRVIWTSAGFVMMTNLPTWNLLSRFTWYLFKAFRILKINILNGWLAFIGSLSPTIRRSQDPLNLHRCFKCLIHSPLGLGLQSALLL